MPAMHIILYAALALTSTTIAAPNGPCSIDGAPGTCIPSAQCAESGGTNRVGFCPDDPTDIKCCIPPPPPPPPTGNPPPPPVDISDNGVKFIAGFEGFEENFYTDDAGVKTIGYGHACQPPSSCDNIDAPITVAEGEALFREDLQSRVQCVKDNVKVPINQNQLDALVSFTYNLGCGRLQEIAEPLNQNDFPAATEQMKEYVNAGGEQLEGLVRRRNEEVALFNS